MGSKKGCIPWNKGKKATDDDRIKKSVEKAHEARKGHSSWNSGKKINRTKYPNMGHLQKHSEESKKKMSDALKGRKAWNKDIKFPQYSGNNHPQWKGGKTKTVSGYIWIHCPQHPSANHGYVYEHRLIIEQHLGRYLTTKEHIHHLGKKDDNRLHMLMAFSSNSAHKRFHHNPLNVKLSEILFDGRNHQSQTSTSTSSPFASVKNKFLISKNPVGL